MPSLEEKHLYQLRESYNLIGFTVYLNAMQNELKHLVFSASEIQACIVTNEDTNMQASTIGKQQIRWAG